MPKFWKSSEFEKLNKEWDKKLQESGFKDAEKGDAEHRVLKERAMDVFHKKDSKNIEKTQLIVDARYQYYQIIGEMTEKEPDFEDEADRLIMQRTAEGKKIKEIAEELKNGIDKGKKRGKHYPHTIGYVIRRYENKWGVKSWSKAQMTSRKPKVPTR